jgi:hypothetical protein
LRFAMTSPPSGCQRDWHPQALEHARHTRKQPPRLRLGAAGRSDNSADPTGLTGQFRENANPL